MRHKWTRRACAMALAAASLCTTSHAQVVSRPTPPPDTTAAGTDWYAARSPLFVGGEWYEPAGASVFFDGNTMVPIASTGGVPLYADTTVEPHSLVFVPIGRGLVQPYERRRSGDLAGTTGSRAPSFPVDSVASKSSRVQPDGSEPVPSGTAVDQATRATAGSVPCLAPVQPQTLRGPLWTARRPEDSRGIWVSFEGYVWVSDGPAVVLDPDRFSETAPYGTFPVYRIAGDDDRIYLPGIGGVVAPYRRTAATATATAP